MKRQRRVASLFAVMLGAAAVLGACGSTATTTTSPSVPGTPPGTNAQVTLGSTPDQPLGDAVEIKIVQTPYGAALGRGNGKVVYAWDKETDGSTICSEAACIEKWPPVTAAAMSCDTGVDKTKFTLVARPDGSQQVAFDGRRLYTMAIDSPGEANCQGTEGWWILNPDGTKNTNTTPIATPGTLVPGGPTTTAFAATTSTVTTAVTTTKVAGATTTTTTKPTTTTAKRTGTTNRGY